MPSKRERRELMLRIIDLAKSVRDRNVDPFEVDVKDLFQRLKKIFPKIEDNEELLLDLRAVLGLTHVVSQQGEWVKHRSSLLYFDPLLVHWKIRELSEKQLANVLIKSWHPIMELECISIPGAKESLDYWTNLLPISERGAELETTEVPLGELGLGELDELGLESREDFDDLMEKTWTDLKKAAGEVKQISYWDFVDGDDFQETLRRAWITSYLVSYGYATLEVKPLEEEIILKPMEERRVPSDEEYFSIPISISRGDWKKRVK